MDIESDSIFDSGAASDSGSSIDSGTPLEVSSGYEAPRVTEQSLDAGGNHIAPAGEVVPMGSNET